MFLVSGENLIDLIASPDGSFVPHAGGAPYNFARAMALQGLAAGYVNPFSTDAFGTLLKTDLLASGALHLGPMTGRVTSLALVATDERGQLRYSFYRDNVADRGLDPAAVLAAAPPDPLGFHTGGLGLVPPDDGCALEMLRQFRARGALCSVDINIRMQVASSMGVAPDRYRAAALAAVDAAHVVKASDEDLQQLGATGAPIAAAQALLARGPHLVILTLGAEGAWALAANYQIFQPALPVELVDAVGAGDCLFTGVLASLHRQGALRELRDRPPPLEIVTRALHHGAVSAAIDVSRAGCQPATWDEVIAWRPTAPGRDRE
jgi:fructokinase